MEILAKLEAIKLDEIEREKIRESARQARAAENRRLFPTAAEALDRFACFSPRLIYAREGGREIGKKPS